MKERRFFVLLYLFLMLVFISISAIFYFFETTQKQEIYKFIYKKELVRHKKDIRLETYAAISYINLSARNLIRNTYKELKKELSSTKSSIIASLDNKTMLINLIKQLNSPGKYKFFISTSGFNYPSTIDLKKCKAYTYFGLKNTLLCESKQKNKNGVPLFFLLLTSKIDNKTTLGIYSSFNNIEFKIAKKVEPKLNNLIFKYKTPDSYFFIAKILNINGGKNFAYNIYNLSKGISIGKLSSSAKKDARGNPYRTQYLKALRKSGETYSVYWYPSPTSKVPQEKVSFRELYKPLSWMVGTGFYVNRIREEAKFFSDSLFEKLKYFNTLLFLIYLLILLSVHFINNKFNRLFSKDTNTILNGALKLGESDEPIDVSKINLESFKLIGTSLNNLSKDLMDKKKQIETNRIEFIKAFVKVLEVRDVYTMGHSERVALYSQKIAEILGMDKKKQYDLYIAGLLHDLGKVAIPDSILLKPGKLSKYEYEVMKLHPLFSYELIKDIGFFKYISIFVKQHHERCDGSGYPDGLKCEEITLEGKILAISDVFDALTTSRPYRKAFSVNKAIEIMKSEPLDQGILSKVEKHLPDILLKEKNQQETTEILDIVEQSRVDLFEKDILTGLYRIKSLIKHLEEKLSSKSDFYLFMVDIKYLKKINYLFGYQVGNELIMKVTQLIKSLEKTEFHSRVGANFFAFIYNGENPVDFKNKLVEKLKEIDIKGHKPEFYVTFLSSAGIKNAEELIYLLEMQIDSLKVTYLKNKD